MVAGSIPAACIFMEKAGKKARSRAQDPRPLHDAGYVKERLRELFRYLVVHTCPFPVSLTQLQTPGRPEVWALATWLVRPLHSERSVRTLQELSTVAKELGYPYPVQQGTPACNLQAVLGFLFWVYDLLKALEPAFEEGPDLVSEHLLNSYGVYMGQGSSDELDLERQRFLHAISGEGEILEAQKATLQRDLARLEERNRVSPVRFQADRLAAQNQSFLTQILAPLEEQRNQLRASLSQPPSVQTLLQHIRTSQASAARLEEQCRQKAGEKTAKEEALQAEKLGKSERRSLSQRLSKLQEEVQDLEYEDFCLRSEVDLLTDRKKRFLAVAEVAAKTQALQEALRVQEDAQDKELRAAREVLRRDMEALQKLGQL